MQKGDRIVTQGTRDRRYPDIYPYGIPIGRVLSVGYSDNAIFVQVQVAPCAKLRGSTSVAALVSAITGAEAAVSVVDGLKAAALFFVAAIIQVSILTQIHVFGGVPDVLLVTLVAVALLRGAVVGAAAGFFAGLLVDTASFGQLGLTSLMLTVAGYWIGRYGETTGRDRAHAPFLSVPSSPSSTRSDCCSCTSCSASARRGRRRHSLLCTGRGSPGQE